MNKNSIRHDLARLPSKGPDPVPGGWEGSYTLLADFTAFDGHFPCYPILPAFAQVIMAQALLEKALGKPCRLTALPTAKFTAQAKPGDELRFHCREMPDSSAACPVFDCRVSSQGREGEQQVAGFRLCLESQDGPHEDQQ